MANGPRTRTLVEGDERDDDVGVDVVEGDQLGPLRRSKTWNYKISVVSFPVEELVNFAI